MNKHQKAIEEIKTMLKSEFKNGFPGWMQSSEIALHQAKLLKKIHAITNGDFSECQCEPFQSCPLCSKAEAKIDWLPIDELIEKGELFWLADKDDNTAEGYLTERDTISIIKSENENFGIAVIFAKIKPPAFNG